MEIAAVVIWRVENTAQAVFDVEDYTSYVEIQSESAFRSIASCYAYDHGYAFDQVDEREITLRGGTDEVALVLKEELQDRLAKAGVIVEDARLTHAAYAPQVIVQNAVSMGQMALDELDQKNVMKLDDQRKAAMLSNLLVVLCGNSDASPVINPQARVTIMSPRGVTVRYEIKSLLPAEKRPESTSCQFSIGAGPPLLSKNPS